MMSIGNAISSFVFGRKINPDASDSGLFDGRRVEVTPVEQHISNDATVKPPVISDEIDRWVHAQVDRIVTGICKPEKTYEAILDDLRSISHSHDMSLIEQYITVPAKYCECSTAIFEYFSSLLSSVARDRERIQKAKEGQVMDDGSCCVSAGEKICEGNEDKLTVFARHLMRLEIGGKDECELRCSDVINDWMKLRQLTEKHWEKCGHDMGSLESNHAMAHQAVKTRYRSLHYSKQYELSVRVGKLQ